MIACLGSAMAEPQDEFLQEIERVVPADLRPLLNRRDGAGLLVEQLPRAFPVQSLTNEPSQRAWELCGLHFFNQGRFHEALPVFQALYDRLITYQEETATRVHKGMPLVWISDCHRHLGRPVLAKRYLMLTACEDAIIHNGDIPAESSGAYFRMVWLHGLSDQQVKRYARAAWQLHERYPATARFPEWILQELDQEWMTEFPTPAETGIYAANSRYIQSLLAGLGSGDGKALERLAHYLVSIMPGCRAYMRQRAESTDYDVVGVLEGVGLDFRAELGRYFVCECKDWGQPADFTTFAKLCRVLDSVKCRFGILFSRQGITGERGTVGAKREQLKVFQDRGMVIVVVSAADLGRVAEGENFIAMLRQKYEKVRLDLQTASEDGGSEGLSQS
jgi:hypothetical protein